MRATSTWIALATFLATGSPAAAQVPAEPSSARAAQPSGPESADMEFVRAIHGKVGQSAPKR